MRHNVCQSLFLDHSLSQLPKPRHTLPFYFLTYVPFFFSLPLYLSSWGIHDHGTGILFVTNIDSSDPDQLVYKSPEPKEEAAKLGPDVALNSYLGL